VPQLHIPASRLGSTDLIVSRIGLGLAALGRPAYINLGRQRDLGPHRSVAELERRCHDMLDAAYAAGVRYVDLLPDLRAAARTDPYLYFRSNLHWTPAGHRVVAATLARAIQSP